MTTNYSSGSIYGITARSVTSHTSITTPDSDSSKGGEFLLAVRQWVEEWIDEGDLYGMDLDDACDQVDDVTYENVTDMETRFLVEAWADLYGWDWDDRESGDTAEYEIKNTMVSIARAAVRSLLYRAQFEEDDEEEEEDWQPEEAEERVAVGVIPGLPWLTT